MFKPHMSICICHKEKRLIVVKKGYCAEGNYEEKQKLKRAKTSTIQSADGERKSVSQHVHFPSKQKGVKIQFKRKGTGEAQIFEEISEEREWRCFVTGIELRELKASTFAHILPKALNKYPLFKLYKPNIQLVADEIHYAWDFKPRSELRKDPRFNKLFELEEKLKEEYKLLKSSL